MPPRTGENPDASHLELAGEVFLGLLRQKYSSAVRKERLGERTMDLHSKRRFDPHFRYRYG